MNPYYDSLKRLYDAGKMTADGVYKWVTLGKISENEYRRIVGLPESEGAGV